MQPAVEIFAPCLRVRWRWRSLFCLWPVLLWLVRHLGAKKGGANLGLAFPYPPAPCAPPAEGSSPPQTARPVQVDMHVCVWGWVRGLDRPRARPFCLLWPSVPGSRVGASSRAPRFQLYVHCVAPCRAPGGRRAPCLCLVPRWHRVRCDVSVVCWFDAFTAACLGVCRLWLV